jgi:hypothetical protein
MTTGNRKDHDGCRIHLVTPDLDRADRKGAASTSKPPRTQRSRLAWALAVATAAAGCAGPPPAAAPSAPSPAPDAPKVSYPTMAPVEQYLIADRDAEIALARSAAPPPVAKDATVMVLTRKGYETAVEGKNGFVCIVERSWTSPFDHPEYWNPNERAPVCLNAPAVRSVLPSELRMTELALAGLTKDAILARMKESIAKKEFGPPEIGAMSYMLSKQQYLNDGDVHWHPHLMFYMPGEMDGSVWGANLPSGSAVFGGGQDMPGGGRMPWTIFFVPVRRWSDGTPAT